MIIFDRCWPGAGLVAAIARLGAHVICRLKSGLDFPIDGPCGDGSHATHLDTGAGPLLPARLIDYRLDTPRDQVDGGRDPDECCTLLTTLTGPAAYPAAEIAGLYPMRWSGAESLIGQNKSTITGAGPSRGPMLRSRTPHQIDQEMYAWLAACQALRITGHGALQAAGAGDGARIAVRARDVSSDPVTARELPFTLARREVIRSIMCNAAATPAHLAAACAAAWRRILARLHPRRPARHRPRACKWRPAFPAPRTRPVTVTGATTITVFGAPPRPAPPDHCRLPAQAPPTRGTPSLKTAPGGTPAAAPGPFACLHAARAAVTRPGTHAPCPAYHQQSPPCRPDHRSQSPPAAGDPAVRRQRTGHKTPIRPNKPHSTHT